MSIIQIAIKHWSTQPLGEMREQWAEVVHFELLCKNDNAVYRKLKFLVPSVSAKVD